jgi:alpha-glucoside transport system substrate-binding protein
MTRVLPPAECLRFFGTRTCPPLPDALPAGVEVEPIRDENAALPSPLVGTEVTLLWQVAQSDPVLLEPLRRELDRFFAETGITVTLVDFPGVEANSLELTMDPPDLVFNVPGSLAGLARQGHFMDMGTYLDRGQLARDQSPYLASLGTIGSDDSWPSDDGRLFGAFVKLDAKSMIWYPVPELHAAGYAIPETTAELTSLLERLRASGRTPLCLGLESDQADGWPGTDWIENLLLAESGTEAYDRWTVHDIPFDSPEVRRAFERFGRLVFPPGSVDRGTDTAVTRGIWDAQLPMIADPPGCWLYLQASFAANFLPRGAVGTQTDVFPFPSGSRSAPELIGGGEMVAAFADRPEVREVVRFLLGPDFGGEMTDPDTSFLRANRRFELHNYKPFQRRQAALLRAALAADTFRFDASDLMPTPVGTRSFNSAMVTYLAQGPDSLDRILEELDAAWPDSG